MRSTEQRENQVAGLNEACIRARAGFSSYLDGALDGRTMAGLADHLKSCPSCEEEFHAWRSLQTALAALGPAQPPAELQAQLRDRLAGELVRGSYRSPLQHIRVFWHQTLAPAGLRFGAGLAATLVILGTAAGFLGSALPVQANDDRLADMTAPKYLYSAAAPEPVTASSRGVVIVVDAKVDAQGRVYDFDLLDGPRDAQTQLQIEGMLLSSVFRPATVFGVPVPGHAMMTYTTVSAQG